MSRRELEMALYAAIREAERRRHEYVTLEHLLLALSYDPKTAKVLRACGVKMSRLRRDLTQHLDDEIESLPEDQATGPVQSVSFQRVLQRAIMHVQSAGKTEITGGNILVAMFAEDESDAVFFLKKQGVSRLDVVNYISHGISKVEMSDSDDDDDDPAMSSESEAYVDEDDEDDPLKAYAINLNERAADGRIDPLIGRVDEVERIVQVLCRRRKNNPLLVGEPGVGKTAIVEGLARLIVEGKVPEPLEDAVIYSLDMGSLLAGTKFRGQFEERLKKTIKRLTKLEHAILFIDEIHTVVGAGATTGGTMDASNMLKPALSSGDIRCVGATTHEDYRRSFYKDPALRRRFQKIDIKEPTIEDAIGILKGLQSRYEEFHEVAYTDEAIEGAVNLSARHIQERQLPDKAIDVIDETGARNRILPTGMRSDTIDIDAVETVVAKIGRMPEINAKQSERERLATLERDLKTRVFGQDDAIEAIATSVKLNRAGLGELDKPVGSFLFVGPTGVGKTEVAKQLANVLGVQFLRFDMSEYQEAHTISRLIGAPPGYVGYDNGGLLTESIRKHPHTVLLLDEIEKAHPNLFDVLLQVMDNATLTDNNGRVADFRNVVLIMTSNAGAREMGRKTIGFGSSIDTTKSLKAVKRTFSPEFRNRLDRVVLFQSLDPSIMKMIVDKFIVELRAQLAEREVEIEVSETAREWLAHAGHDELFGARPLKRVIESTIKMELADELLFGKLADGGRVRVDCPAEAVEEIDMRRTEWAASEDRTHEVIEDSPLTFELFEPDPDASDDDEGGGESEPGDGESPDVPSEKRELVWVES